MIARVRAAIRRGTTEKANAALRAEGGQNQKKRTFDVLPKPGKGQVNWPLTRDKQQGG
jgi:hypothetical protein